MKSLAEFRARRREKSLIVFSDDMRVRKNSLREAPVRLWRAGSGAKPSPKRGYASFWKLLTSSMS